MHNGIPCFRIKNGYRVLFLILVKARYPLKMTRSSKRRPIILNAFSINFFLILVPSFDIFPRRILMRQSVIHNLREKKNDVSRLSSD